MARSDSLTAPARESKGGRSLVDRVIVALALLAVAALAALIFLLGIGVVAPAQLAGGSAALEGVLRLPLEADGWTRVGVVAGSLVTSLCALLALVSRGGGAALQGAGFHVIDSDDLGVVLVDTDGVAAVVEHAVLATGGVADCVAHVRGTGSSPIRVVLHIGVQPRTSVQRAGVQAREAAKQAVERLVGLEVRDVHVKARVLEADELGRRVA